MVAGHVRPRSAFGLKGSLMRFARGLSLIAVALAALAAPVPGLSVAGAEAIPDIQGYAQITAVAPADPSPAESRVLLSFNPSVTQFSIIGNDADTAVVAFADTRLAPNLTFPGG